MEDKRESPSDRRKKPRPVAKSGRRKVDAKPVASAPHQASLIVNSLVLGIVGVVIAMLLATQSAHRMNIELDVDQTARLLFMAFAVFSLTAYFFQTSVARFMAARRASLRAASRPSKTDAQGALPKNWGDVLEQRLMAFDPVLEADKEAEDTVQRDRYINRPDSDVLPFEGLKQQGADPAWQPPLVDDPDPIVPDVAPPVDSVAIVGADHTSPAVAVVSVAMISMADSILDAFVAGAVEAIEASDMAGDTNSRFGLYLYAAGACVECSRQKSWTAGETKQAIVRTLKQLAVSDLMAQSLAAHIDEFASVPEFRSLIDSGRMAMASFLNDATDQTSALADLLAAWRNQVADMVLPDLSALLMTKLTVDSASGQTITPEDRARVGHGHHNILKEACGRFGGRIVTVTHGGIAATFVDSERALRAAIDLQNRSDEWISGRGDLKITVHVALDWELTGIVADRLVSLGIPRGIEILNLVLAGDIVCTEGFKGQIADSQELSPLFFPNATVVLPPLFAAPRARVAEAAVAPVEYRYIGSQPRAPDTKAAAVSDLDKWLAESAKVNP